MSWDFDLELNESERWAEESFNEYINMLQMAKEIEQGKVYQEDLSKRDLERVQEIILDRQQIEREIIDDEYMNHFDFEACQAAMDEFFKRSRAEVEEHAKRVDNMSTEELIEQVKRDKEAYEDLEKCQAEIEDWADDEDF